MEIPIHNEDMSEDETQILPCISISDEEDIGMSLKYPVLGAFMNVRFRELYSHQQYWNRTSRSNRIRIIREERDMQSQMLIID